VTEYEDEWGVVKVEKGDTIKVGIAFGLTGVGTDVLGIDELRGAELALKDKPEIMGFEVEQVVEDEMCNAEGTDGGQQDGGQPGDCRRGGAHVLQFMSSSFQDL
jgi:hypothetical protein